MPRSLQLFGQTAAGIRIGLLLANALTIVLVYVLGKRLYGRLAGAVAGASYALLSVGPWVNGFAGHATHFVVLAAMAGLLLLLEGIDGNLGWKFFLSGVLLGFGFLMKQPGIGFAVFGALYMLWAGLRTKQGLRLSIRHFLCYSAGAILPFATTCLLLWRAGVFRKFWFWTFSYACQYGTNVGVGEGWRFFVENFSKASLSAIALWMLAGAGLQ